MKNDFEIKIESYHLPDAGTTENAHHLPPELLAKREVIVIDIANDTVASQVSLLATFDSGFLSRSNLG